MPHRHADRCASACHAITPARRPIRIVLSNFEALIHSRYDAKGRRHGIPAAGKMPLVFYEWRQSWLPELLHVDEPRGREKFYARAIVHLLSREAVGAFSFLAWGLLFAEFVAALILWFWLSDRFTALDSDWVFNLVYIPLSILLAPVVGETTILLIGHRRASAFLRKDLSENGWPTCLECGYDLWGREEHERERMCPECGSTWTRPERRNSAAQIQ